LAAGNGYNMDTIARLLQILRSNSPISRARLAKLGSMNTRTLEKYLDGLLVPLGMVEERINGRRKKEYVITPLGAMASVLLSTLHSLFDKEQYEFRKRIVDLVEEELRRRGLRVRNLLATRCSLSTPADLFISNGERSTLLYIALNGDDAVVKSVIGLGASVLNNRRARVIVATPEKPCINLDDGRWLIYIVYYDPGSPAGAAREIARSVEHVLSEDAVILSEARELGMLRI
jgi:predicted transcriptional regulator